MFINASEELWVLYMKLPKPVAFIGCGHSGTFFISEVCQYLGIDVRHETPGSDGVSGWNYTHLTRRQFPFFGMPRDSIVFHQTRNPLNVTSSLQARGDDPWRAVGERAKYRGIDWNPLDDPHPVRGMLYWVYWNTMAEALKPRLQYCVENIKDELPKILSILKVPQIALPRVSANINKHDYNHTFTWEELEDADGLLYQQVRAMAKRYGYDR